MKTSAICFVALFAVAFGRSVNDDYEYVNGEYERGGYEPEYDEKIAGINDRIFGGQETTIEQHPHQVSLRRNSRHWCGGSILTAVRALSGAHCHDKHDPAARYSIQAGSTARTGDADAQVRTLSRFVTHARWNTPRLTNDIALLFWDEPLTFGANVQPIRLPREKATVPYGQNATASGWGGTGAGLAHNLKVVTLPLVSNEDCNRAYKGKIVLEMVCAGGEAGRGGCNGDSGGPLVHSNTLIGVTSWSEECGKLGFPTVYARVAFYIDWINQNIN